MLKTFNQWSAEDLAALFAQVGMKPKRGVAIERNADGLWGCVQGALALAECVVFDTGSPVADYVSTASMDLHEVGYPRMWAAALSLGFDGEAPMNTSSGYLLGRAVADIVFAPVPVPA